MISSIEYIFGGSLYNVIESRRDDTGKLKYYLNMGNLYILFDNNVDFEEKLSNNEKMIKEPLILEFKEAPYDNVKEYEDLEKVITDYLKNKFNLQATEGSKFKINIEKSYYNNFITSLKKAGSLLKDLSISRLYIDATQMFSVDPNIDDTNNVNSIIFPETIKTDIIEFLSSYEPEFKFIYDIDEDIHYKYIKSLLKSIVEREKKLIYQGNYKLHTPIEYYTYPIRINVKMKSPDMEYENFPVYLLISKDKVSYEFADKPVSVDVDITEFIKTHLPNDIYKMLEALDSYVKRLYEAEKKINSLFNEAGHALNDMHVVLLGNKSQNYNNKSIELVQHDDLLCVKLKLRRYSGDSSRPRDYILYYDNGVIFDMMKYRIMPTLDENSKWIYELFENITGPYKKLKEDMDKLESNKNI